MNFIYNKKNYTNNFINEIIKVSSLIILIIIISLGIYDIDINFSEEITIKNFLNNMNYWWSTWTMQLTFFSSIILLYLNIKLYLKNNVLKNVNYIKYIYFLKLTNVVSITLTLLVYNFISFFVPSQMVADPVFLLSDIEHIFYPILFILYFLLTRKQFNVIINKKINIIKIILISSNYTLAYIINILILSFLTHNYVYSESDPTKIGYLGVIGFALLTFLGSCLLSILYFLITKKKNINKYDILYKKNVYKSKIEKYNYYSFINSIFNLFIFYNLIIILWTDVNTTRLNIMLLKFLFIIFLINLFYILLYIYFCNKKNTNKNFLYIIFLTKTIFGLSVINFIIIIINYIKWIINKKINTLLL